MNDAPLLPYQVRWNQDRNPVKFCEKSRRIGLSYADAAEAAMLASLKKSDGGMNTFYISYNKEMTETYIKDVADWAIGGFSCQDISCAGKGAGITGERSGLWSEYARILRELRPR